MDMSKLSLRDLYEQMSRVRAQLSSQSTLESYLSRARADTPIIDEFIKQIGFVMQAETFRNRKTVLELMHRELIILLALRQIEQENARAEASFQAQMN